jgi:molecular chaperone GrpE (heat shock protein)
MYTYTVDDFGDVVPKINYEEKIVALEKDIRDLKDRVMRSLAEEENVSFYCNN